MAFTEIEVANIALTKIGSERISSLNEATNTARTVNTCFHFVRKQVLSHGVWNFAMKNSTLSKLPTSSNPEFASEFQLPSSCLKVVKLNGQSNIPFRVEGDRLFCDLDEVSVKYIDDIENAGLFAIEFIEAFTHKLAADICFRLTQNQSRANQLATEYHQLVLPMTRLIDAQESAGDTFEVTDLTDVRF